MKGMKMERRRSQGPDLVMSLFCLIRFLVVTMGVVTRIQWLEGWDTVKESSKQRSVQTKISRVLRLRNPDLAGRLSMLFVIFNESVSKNRVSLILSSIFIL